MFNGEIYNFMTLRKELAAQGHRFNTQGDTEVLLYAYRAWGVAMLEHLQGMFAFALWDRAAQRLFLARDHLGVKPLYYHWDGATLVFGSELKALIEHPEVSREIDLDALALVPGGQYIPAPHSVYRSVRKLEPGHALKLERGELSLVELLGAGLFPASSSSTTTRRSPGSRASCAARCKACSCPTCRSAAFSRAASTRAW